MIRRIILTGAFLVTAIAGAMVLPAPAAHADEPVDCTGPIIAFDRQRWCGYFRNIGFDGGEEVRIGGIPSGVNTAQEWIDLIDGDLHSGNQHRVTAAQFVILTMLGEPGGSPKTVTAAQQAEWEARVKAYASTSENGTRSTGPNGRIDWNVSMHTACNTVNTYYQTGQNDVAPFRDTPANSDCEDPTARSRFILFRDESGSILYMIRRICMNPMGNLRPLEPPKPPDFNLQPTISTTVGGAPSSDAEVGDVIRFRYTVNNTGPDASPLAGCTLYANVRTGYFAATPGSPTSGSNPPGYVPPPTGCPRVFPPGSTALTAEDVPVTADNRTICRSLFVSPASQTVASRGYEACVHVVRKPYVKVFKGDISAGNGLASAAGACMGTPAAIISWNKRAAGGYAGSGVQYAAYALGSIRDVATASGNTGGAAPPSGLAFANTAANPGIGVYGGSFGELPCILDYYGNKPATTNPLPAAVSGISATGVYAAAAGVNLGGGTLLPGTRATVYVDGDVYITGNITYGGSWTAGNMPLFRVIARGNIYIDRNVTQLDGLFVAQPAAGAGGTIYTCTTGAVALTPDSSLSAICGSPLTINGGFTARRIMLLRTNGSLTHSTPSESPASTTIAETFNYSPALWIAQPITEQPIDLRYDSITGLPPIL